MYTPLFSLSELNWKSFEKHSFTLFRGNVLRLPKGLLVVQIVSGDAWITLETKDITMKTGEIMLFAVTQANGLISSLGRTPLVIEVIYPNQTKLPTCQWLRHHLQQSISWKKVTKESW
jgi:hypothetical protein